jgi:hypothetical protein
MLALKKRIKHYKELAKKVSGNNEYHFESKVIKESKL